MALLALSCGHTCSCVFCVFHMIPIIQANPAFTGAFEWK